MDVLHFTPSTRGDSWFEGYEVGVASWDKKHGNDGTCLSVRVRYKNAEGGFSHSSPETGLEHILPVLAACIESGAIAVEDGELKVQWDYAREKGWTPKPVAA